MKKIHIKSIEHTIELTKTLTSITIENPICYRNIAYDISNEIIYSENNSTVDIDKYGLIITNPFEISINDTRLIKSMYKKLDRFRTDEDNIKISKINEEIKTLIYGLSYNLDIAVEVSNDIDFLKLLSSVDLKFIDPTFQSFTKMFVKYVKVYMMFTNINVLFTFNLFELFTEEELKAIIKELELLDIIVIDFKMQKKNINSTIIIDEDWCII